MESDETKRMLNEHHARMEQLDQVVTKAMEGQEKMAEAVTVMAQNHDQLVHALKIKVQSDEQRFQQIEQRQEAIETRLHRPPQPKQLPAPENPSDSRSEFSEGLIDGLTGKWLLGGKK